MTAMIRHWLFAQCFSVLCLHDVCMHVQRQFAYCGVCDKSLQSRFTQFKHRRVQLVRIRCPKQESHQLPLKRRQGACRWREWWVGWGDALVADCGAPISTTQVTEWDKEHQLCHNLTRILKGSVLKAARNSERCWSKLLWSPIAANDSTSFVLPVMSAQL